jgi:pyruvate dehydrogenase E2 component (dihydrolipoamide acetyltransferase)
MATEIVMPNLGFDVQQARLIEWLKQPGDPVRQGEVIAIVESDKANVELESIASGVLLEQLVEPGVETPVGAVIARVGEPAEQQIPASTEQSPTESAAEQTPDLEVSPVARKLAADHAIDLATVAGTGPRGRVTREDVEAVVARRSPPAIVQTSNDGTTPIRALPKVRKAARLAGVNLADVPATGANGVITLADVQAFASPSVAASPAAPTVEATEAQPVRLPSQAPTTQTPEVQAGQPPEGARATPLSRIRQLIGQRMSESKRTAPHFYVTGEFDLEGPLRRLKTLPEPQPGINDLIQYVAVQALQRTPALNAILQDETVYQFDAINLAIAVARDEGLITPVLHDAGRFSLTGLAQESRKLIERTRANKLQVDDLQGATFTISNLGIIRQIDQFVAIINPPQVAILAVGTVKQRPTVIDGGLHIRHTVHLTLSGDHRVVDGMHLGQFMTAFQTELDNFSQEK